ncbi:subtilisin-like protein [Acephala macrosclerotiorum]|nr:subtilisin-like protein [Acephala macrosclerotiorum]
MQQDLNDTAPPTSFLDSACNCTITPTCLRALYNIGDYQADPDAGPLVPDLNQPVTNDSSNDPYLDFLDYVLSLPDCELPQTITTSYGENEQSVPEAFSRTVCDKFGQLGLRGVSVLLSSGDSDPGSACLMNNGKNTMRFLPTFPGACPYVTSVGGTRYVEPKSAVYFSSGGFSDRFERPKYQDRAVKDYLKILEDQWKGLYNEKGRVSPDVAAQEYQFAIVNQNRTIGISGTSASSPAFAAVVPLLNNARPSEGKKPLGFLNPWL